MTKDVLTIKKSLHSVIDEMNTDSTSETEISTPTPPTFSLTGAEDELEIALVELLQKERWTEALSFVKLNRESWNIDLGAKGDDDINIAVMIYSRKITRDKPGN